ncbi:hypothetical protein [Acetobacterium woodii]|uniref:Uncharacterized protein n=1 Tax=Acetobacterium woodii (strain ATCC 29683 / DSM 1030 / JCM 2381 / KCTC 1655 / WB1) TaxID=931626 RepID=H6LKL6_ACEWD|nr:hypothetical protein [Acetobacterium woodii]AFA48808.1 hypothetical protein Awo_c20300 [Acetobacterium woodii DSM 1030]
MDAISLNSVELQGSTSSLSKRIDEVTVKPTSDSIYGQNAADDAANSYYKYDTMELSREYVGYRSKSENAVVNSDTQQLNSTIDQKPAKLANDEFDDSIEIKDDNSQTSGDKDVEDKAISSYQLAGYTNSELKGLVLAGKITTVAYNTEMKNRQDETESVGQQAQTQKPKTNENPANSII